LIDHGVGINFGHWRGDSSLFSLVLLSPIVVNAVIVEGEGKELNADVGHLEVEVKVGTLKVLMALVFVFRAETVNLLEIVVLQVASIVVVQHHSEALQNKNHQNSS